MLFLVGLFLVVGGILAPDTAHAQELGPVASLCAQCHLDVDAGRLQALDHGNGVSCLTCHHLGYTNDPDRAARRRLEACASCHSTVPASHVGVEDGAPTCVDCHTIHETATTSGPGSDIAKRCQACHAVEHPLHAVAGPEGPTCTDCHTAHTGVPFRSQDHASVGRCSACHLDAHPTHVATGARLPCTRCHAEREPPGPAGADPSTSATCRTCHTDVAERHIDAGGNTMACVACHDFGKDVSLARDGAGVSERCASCHPTVVASFRASGHLDVGSGDPARDVSDCLACHTEHQDPRAPTASLRLAATERCLVCHRPGGVAGLGRSYADDFHGATMEFLAAQGQGRGGLAVMGCTDCHGPHEGAPLDRESVAAVCLRCHETADTRLVGAWLGHEPVGPHSQPLVWMVRLSYYVLIPFMLAGLLLNIVFHLVDQRREGARVMETTGMRRLLARLGRDGGQREGGEMVMRFSLVERLEHAGSAVAFILLVVTGLPQTRPDVGTARAVIEVLGGIGSTRVIHRLAGFTFLALLLTHVTRAVGRALRTRTLPVMVPTRQDFLDVVQTFRHYLFGGARPRVGRFDFAEKFEYWGLFLGGAVMSTTGVLLVFPELASHVFPGSILAAARVVHGLEATLAVSVVIVWHSYGVILRPEIFPLDTSMFTGKISVSRLRREHALEYEQRAEEGEIASADGTDAGRDENGH